MMRILSNKSPFEEKEEVGGVMTRKAILEIKDGSRVVVRCVVAIIEEDGEPVKLYTNFQPLNSDVGLELRREEVFSGDFARAYADLIASARDYLGDYTRPNRSDSSRSVHIDLDI